MTPVQQYCCMTEVLIKFNTIPANIEGGGSSNENNQGGEIKTVHQFPDFGSYTTVFTGSTCHTTSQLKLVEREISKYNSSSTRCNLLVSFYPFFNSDLARKLNTGLPSNTFSFAFYVRKFKLNVICKTDINLIC